MGALLTVGGGAFLGFDAHRRLRRRARVLRQLAGALEQMDREIAFRLTPMPQLMEETMILTLSQNIGLLLDSMKTCIPLTLILMNCRKQNMDICLW